MLEPVMTTIDGNVAAAHVAHLTIENVAIHPSAKASSTDERAHEWASLEGRNSRGTVAEGPSRCSARATPRVRCRPARCRPLRSATGREGREPTPYRFEVAEYPVSRFRLFRAPFRHTAARAPADLRGASARRCGIRRLAFCAMLTARKSGGERGRGAGQQTHDLEEPLWI